MGNLPAWSIILQGIIKSPLERQRLSSALDVTSMTLMRWANGESRPQRTHLIHLVQAVHPHQRAQLLEALEQSYPEIQSWLKEDTSGQIPSEFFAQILSMRTTTTESLHFWRMSEMILKQALLQLDPNNLGMAVKLIQCMPPDKDGKVRSLRERAGKGTPPWITDLEHDVLFLGLESMCGYAVEVHHVVSDNDLRKNTTFPFIKDQFEISAAAQPILFEGRIAGCLLASSTQEGYFSQQRLALLETSSNVISLAFNRQDFYSAQQIELRVMPPPERQRPILAHFRQRVTAKFQEAMTHHTNLSSTEIEMLSWKEIEAELLSLQDAHQKASL